MAQASGVEPMMRKVSEYIATALDKPLPDAVVEKGQHHILDTIAAVAVGKRLKPGKVGLAVLKAQGSSDQCTVGLTAERASVVDAAFAVGMLAGAGETDELALSRPHASGLCHRSADPRPAQFL